MHTLSGILSILCGIFVGMVVAFSVGRRFARARRAEAMEEAESEGVNAIMGGVFALVTLLIAFTFADAAARLNERRRLVVEEANAIGTAYLRLDVLDPVQRDPLRAELRRYVELRLEFYRVLRDPQRAKQAAAAIDAQQRSIWAHAVVAAGMSKYPSSTILLLPALNAMIDAAGERAAILTFHIPGMLVAMLAFLSLCCALYAGVGSASASKVSALYRVGFAVILTVCIYVVLDLEHPRGGLIRVDSADHLLVNARNAMN